MFVADAPRQAGRTPRRVARAGGACFAMLWLIAALNPAPHASAAPATSAAPVASGAQPAEAGLPFIHNFAGGEYGGSPQNWALAQAPDGVIYVGNASDGVLAFDGKRWRRTSIPNDMLVRSLAATADGRIFVGTVGDFGYLAPDTNGRMQYTSLLSKVPESEREFSDVWNIHIIGADVWFGTLTKLFRLHDHRISVIKPRNSFHLSMRANDTIYVRDVGHGLMRVVGDHTEAVPGGERFADERIYTILPWRGADARPGELLLGTRTQGWFRYDGKTFTPWPTTADAAMQAAAIYGATWLADGRLAVATLQGGLFVLDTHGRLVGHLTRASGLATDVIYALLEDRQHGLWLATGNGVTRVDIASPLSHFGERSGLRGAVMNVIRHHGTLYAATTEGAFRLLPDANRNAWFEQLAGIPGMTWSFNSFDDQLLAASNDGLFRVLDDGSVRSIVKERRPGEPVRVRELLRSRRDPARLYVGYRDGLGSLRWNGNRWIDEGRLANITDEITGLNEDAEGQLWFGTWAGGMTRVRLPPAWQGAKDPRPVQIDRYGVRQGLPGGQQQLALIDGQLRFFTSEGIYRFDAASGSFAPDPAFQALFPGGPRRVASLHQDLHGDLWIYASGRDGVKETARARKVEGRWQWTSTPLQPLDGSEMFSFYDDPDGVVWIAGYEGLFRYDPGRTLAHDTGFTALIREVVTHEGQVLHGGSGEQVPVVPFSDNAVRFELAAPSFDSFDANRFQVYLEGVDRDWSRWSRDAYRDYTNLHEGNYRFRVRARNVYGDESREASFEFRVLPPWFRSWWAWALWITGSLVVIFLFVRWRSAALQRRNRALATLVHQRTAELQRANEALAEQSVTDPLTGLKNRRYLYDHIEQDLALARRQGGERPGAVERSVNANLLFLMVDIDHFKQVNDTWGHAAGDHVLQQLRDILLTVTRESDITVRWGGEEFLIVARFATRDAGPAFAERVRAAVAGHSFELGDGCEIQRTCSIGFASYPACASEPDALDWEQVINLADDCLYAAKHRSRNAWAGVLPLTSLPSGSISEALGATLAKLPEPGPLPVSASWLSIAETTTAECD